MNKLKKMFASANERVIKWSDKHNFVMYGFGMLLLFGALAPLILMTFMVACGASPWSLGIVAPLGLILAFVGFQTSISAVFRFPCSKK